MALEFYQDKDKGYCISFEHNGVKHVLCEPRWFPPVQFFQAWIGEILSKDVMEEFYKLQEKYCPSAWDDE